MKRKPPQPASPDEARKVPDEKTLERETALDASLEELRVKEAFDYRYNHLPPGREERITMINDEVTIMRQESSEREREFRHKPQKTLE